MSTTQPASALRRYQPQLKKILIVVLIIWALYLVAANVFLNTSIGVHTINRKPERFQAQWGWAMSLYPGHIYAKTLKLNGHSRDIKWSAEATKANGRISIFPLLTKTLNFGWINADDIHLVVNKTDDFLPPTINDKTPWQLNFNDIQSSSFLSVRYNEWKIVGTGDADFSIKKELKGGDLEIPPSTARFQNASVYRGDLEVSNKAVVEVALEMLPHTRDEAQGKEKVNKTKATVKVRGNAPGLDLREKKTGALDLKVAGKEGQLLADIEINEGLLEPGGKLHWSIPILLEGAETAEEYRAQVIMDVHDNDISVKTKIPALKEGNNYLDTDLRVRGRQVLRTDPKLLLKDVSGVVKLKWHFGSLKWINPMLTKTNWLRLNGEADIAADMKVENGKLMSGSYARIENADLNVNVFDAVFSGQAHADAKISEKTTTIDIVANTFHVADKKQLTKPYVLGNDLKVYLVSSESIERFHEDMQARLQFTNAQIPDLRTYNRSLPGNSLKFLGGSGLASGDFLMDANGELVKGEAVINGKQADIAIGTTRLSGNLVLNAKGRRTKAGTPNYAVDVLTLDLSDVRHRSAPAAGAWWAKINVASGNVDWAQPLKMRGNANVQMKDASLLFSLFAERSEFPNWLGKVIDQGQVDARSLVSMNGETIIFDDINVKNERLQADARMKLNNGVPSGVLYAQWGKLGIGMELDNGQRKMHLKNAQEWYQTQPRLIKK